MVVNLGFPTVITYFVATKSSLALPWESGTVDAIARVLFQIFVGTGFFSTERGVLPGYSLEGELN